MEFEEIKYTPMNMSKQDIQEHPLYDSLLTQCVERITLSTSDVAAKFMRAFKTANIGEHAVFTTCIVNSDDDVQLVDEYNRYDIYQLVEDVNLMGMDFEKGKYVLLWRFGLRYEGIDKMPAVKDIEELRTPYFIICVLEDYGKTEAIMDDMLCVSVGTFITLMKSCMLVEFGPEGFWE